MKSTLSFATALLITLAIFSFMRYLITTDQDTLERTEIAGVVELYRTPPKTEPPEPEEIDEPEPLDEPQMESLSVQSATPTPTVTQTAPILNLGSISINVGQVGDQWSVPVSGKAAGFFDGGEGNQGYIEVVPYSTMQPNIPEIAWQNKVNGWVLVAFHVKPNGHTTKIRILDANPKGVFEETVLKAVTGWRYSEQSLKGHKGNMVLTQKVELFWKDYPSNVP